MSKVWYLVPERDADHGLGTSMEMEPGERDARVTSRLLVLPPASVRLSRRARRTKKSPL